MLGCVSGYPMAYAHSAWHRAASESQQLHRRLGASLVRRLNETTATAERALLASGYERGPSSWWANMGHSGQVLAEIELLRRLVNDSHVKTACEIGFNAGHAAVALLDGLQTNLVEFDLLALPYSNASRAALEAAYPGRTRFIAGKSQVEVPKYAALVRQQLEPRCDLWFVDGDHTHGTLLDMKAALSAASDGAIIIADDCSPKHKPVQVIALDCT